MFDYVRDYVAMETAKRDCQFAKAATLAEGLMMRQSELNRISPFFGYEPYAVYAPLSRLAKHSDTHEDVEFEIFFAQGGGSWSRGVGVARPATTPGLAVPP